MNTGGAADIGLPAPVPRKSESATFVTHRSWLIRSIGGHIRDDGRRLDCLQFFRDAGRKARVLLLWAAVSGLNTLHHSLSPRIVG